MRLHITFSSDGSTVPYNHLTKLTGTLHKWIGANNDEHGDVSLYSFSWLQGAEKSPKGDGLVFRGKGSFFVSAYENSFIQQLVTNIQVDTSMFCGLRVTELVIQADPEFANKDRFEVASPVFVKRKQENVEKHFEYNQPESSAMLRETLLTKMAKAGLNDDSLEIQFDTSYRKAFTKLVHYGSIKNKANYCPVIIKGNPETKAFAWNVGLGNSTGIGFGALR